MLTILEALLFINTSRKEGFEGRNSGDLRAAQQGGEPIRRRRILWEQHKRGMGRSGVKSGLEF
ncbi:MAG: hypothetical protein A2667_02055 [Candidatus Wildermuthbacteria bacterium RIFCSPHIGHO2_01_FULL_47_27]|nr:MAG: hypothetical protein UY15_C0033G0005 [Parcubacteria group bacterium GW2011_GWA2_47_9]OHA64306.1 MAG: hypothetical protein A2667_02055 [Candidatus Wildermuthbacteria bacterium RIFCSPHIGHO2_01_FULL_47_27]OHA75939.1 MAG: hypothetical protein A3I38_04025 [Candidatus Wildermuthbacteria bacterium RIFCSPLOWO2_02_FULL_47_10]